MTTMHARFLRLVRATGLLLLLCLWPGPGWPQATDQRVALPLAAGETLLDNGALAMRVDRGGEASLDDVRAADARGEFIPLSGALTAGYTTDVYWLRIRLRNHDELTPYWLEILPVFLDDLRLYEVLPDGVVRTHRAGDRVPVSVHDSRSPSPMFILRLPQGDTTLYLRIQTSSSLLALPALYRPVQLQRRLTTQGIQYGAYFGLLVAIMLLNLVNWYLLRDRLFAVYVVYLGVQLVYFAAAYGLTAQYLFPEHPSISDTLVGVGLGASLVTGALFYTRLLGIARRGAPFAWYAFMGGMVIGVVGAASAIGGFYVHVAPLMQVSMLVVFLAGLRHVARLIARGTFEQRLAAVSFVLYMLPVIIGALAFAGVLEASRNTLFAAQVGNGVHLWLLHFVITRRVRDAELAREEYARQAAVARVEAEQERRRNVEQAGLLSMITHEVRTPVAVIRSAMQSLRLVDPEPPPERNVRYERIDRSARRMNMLLELLLAGDPSTRVTSAARRQPVDLMALTREAIGQVDPEQVGRVILSDAGRCCRIDVSSDLLCIALTNLVDNALKYSPAGSPVRVSMACRPDAGVVEWMVDDSGPGVPEDERETIFRKYWRGGESSGAPGLGLGLYIVREIVESVGGNVSCGAAPGGGARFVCKFPVFTCRPAGEGPGRNDVGGLEKGVS